MKRKNKIVALFMATIMIISNLVVPVKEVYAATKVDWGKSISTGYYWGPSGDIKIKQIKAKGKLERAFCLEPEKWVTTVEGYKETYPKYEKAVWNKLCSIAHVGYNKEKNTKADYAADAKANIEVVDNALRNFVSKEFREAVMAHIVEGLNYNQIEARYGVSQEDIKEYRSRLIYAVAEDMGWNYF